jgi:two-component sensor histidine kinase
MPVFCLIGRERGGPPVAEPLHKGFGLVILKTVVPAVFGGTAELRTLSSGACWSLEAPLNNLLAAGNAPASPISQSMARPGKAN